MSEATERCKATTDGVMGADYRCGYAAGGHDRHRARTEFGEIWWTTPGEAWVSPVATTSADEEDGYAATRDALAAAEARGRQQMIDADQPYCATCGEALPRCPDCGKRFCGYGDLEQHTELGTCPDYADGADSIAKEGSRKLLTDEEYEQVERSAVASVRTGHTVGCLCNACERERGRPVTPEARVLLYRTDAGEGRRDG